MFRFFPDQIDDLLDAENLPPTDRNELNYRTRPLTVEQEQRLTLVLLFGLLPIVVILSATFSAAKSIFGWFDFVLLGVGSVFIVWFAFRRLTGAIARRDLIAAALFSVGCTGAAIWNWMELADVWGWRVGLLAAWIASCLIARQAAAWILVGPTVDHERMERWKMGLPCIIPRGLLLDCPESLTFYIGPALVGPAWILAAWVASHFLGALWLWPLCFVASVPIVWLSWHVFGFLLVPWPDFQRSLAATWQALTIFVTYDIHHTPAAGVFRFPTRWLRHPLPRWMLIGFVLVIIAFSYATCCPDPFGDSQSGWQALAQLLINYVMICITGPLVLFGVLWLIAGTLLARFDSELSYHQDPNTTDWDNYVDRLVNSDDELEREHILAGTSEKGDYPVLIHSTIHDMHGHLLGDTGASKTTLGVAPQATQLIARADSTVVIVDLKGDRALFETCRREAARTKKLRFRWLSNEVGKSTFAFNPFLQSHNRLLTAEQLTQELLQGLSLDYGLEYGAGYFTAMNEIVLNNVVKSTGARSFRELNRWLSDRDWYETIGHAEDWRQARHLGALVSRLAASEAINVVPGMYPDQPEVYRQSIDVANLYDEPQVVYLNLRSAVEPTNAPAIARLFLWSMFTAASHQPQEGKRVYFFIDEVQQIISDGMKLIFEQFRDLGGTIIAAHQTAGQLNRQGTDLADTIDSCTAVKQIFRASDLRSLERLERLSGKRKEAVAMWMQAHERGTGELADRYDPVLAKDGVVRVSEREQARLDSDALLSLGARRQSSLIRFTFGSGYTQFAGASVPIVSQFSISMDEYKRRRQRPWPEAPGAFTISPPSTEKSSQPDPTIDSPDESGTSDAADFTSEFERRGKRESAKSRAI